MPELTSITTNTIASKQISTFVSQIQEQYGKGNMVLNVHSLLHLPACVKKWGPIWVYWCFPFERILGVYSQFVFSTKNPVLSYCISSQLNNAFLESLVTTELVLLQFNL